MKYNSKSEKDNNIFRSVIETFFPFWPLFLILVIVSLLAGWGYLQYATPVYEASASMIIKDKQKGVDESRIMESMNPFETKKIVENEIEVLHSRDLMSEVVRTLKLYAPIYEDDRMRSIAAYTSSPVKVVVDDPGKIKISKDKPKKYYFKYNKKMEEVLFSGKRYALNQWIKILDGQNVMFIKNERKNSEADKPLYFQMVNPKIISNDLVKDLDVSATNKLSSVVNLSIEDPVPERAEDILDHLIQEYNQRIIKDREELAFNTLAFIEERIENVEKELGNLDYQIEEYRSNQGAVDLSEQGKLYLQDVGENDKQISEMELQLSVLDNVENYVISKGSAGGIVPSTLGINDPILSQLIEKLYNLEVDYERLKRTTAENNPVLTSISNQITKIRPSILENVKSQKQNLQSRLSSLQYNNRRYNSTLSNIPGKERALLEINREKTIKNNLFSYLLQKREETALANLSSNENGALINRAEASVKPVSPKPIFTYLISFSLALALGIGYVKGKEVLSGKILYRSEIEEYTNIPIIAELCYVKNKSSKSKKFKKPEDFVLIEQLRHLGARLGLYRRDLKQRKILITSGSSGEGKSFVSANLAYSLAQAGKKVILVDMDFRKPYTSEMFNLSTSKGIIGYLKGEVNYEEIVHQSEVNPNFYIVPTGAKGDDYSATLLNGKLEYLMASFSEDFEYIILDCAPINVLAEVNLMAENSERTLYIIKHDHTSKESVKRLDDSPNLKSLKNISIVFNGLKNRGMVQSEYGYGNDLKYNLSSYAQQS